MDRARLSAIRVLAGCPEHELDAIARVASEREVPAGEELTTEGDFGHALFAIEEGSADVTQNGTQIGRAGPGDIIGEIAVLSSGRRTASVRAATPLKVIVWFKRDVWALEREAPEAARCLRAALEKHRGESAHI
jgi:CRP-like cAMP-binding protein